MFAGLEIPFVFGLLATVFVLFMSERFSPDIIALGAVVLLLITGILETNEFLQVFSNGAPIAIAMMFIISAALEATGCLEVIGKFLHRIAGKSFFLALLSIMMIALVASAFMNNTPVVIVLPPLIISIARTVGVASSKMLIPLSFAAIFGGMTTLIGTSTNLLVNGVAVGHGLPAIGMFEMTLPGLILAAVGMVYMLLAGRFLLPKRHSLTGLLENQPKRQFIAELMIPQGSEYIGQTIAETGLDTEKTNVLDVIRGHWSLRHALGHTKLRVGDRLVVETNAGELLHLKENGEIDFKPSDDPALEGISAQESVIMEGSISPDSSFIGKRIESLGLRRKYGLYVLAVHRNDTDIRKDFDRIVLRFGDTLLLEGNAEGVARLMDDGDLINLSEPQEQPVRKEKAPIALFTLVAVVGLAALNVMPIAGLALAGAVTVIMTGCIDTDRAYKSIDWNILFLIFGMLGFSMAMEKTGAALWLVTEIMGLVEGHSPVFILGVVYVLTWVMTETISNNAVAVLIAPIAIALAEQLGLDSRPFLMAVMFASSASFSTPIGYQTNTFVYSAGGYKFTDFMIVGLPLNVLFALVATYIIPIFFPF